MNYKQLREKYFSECKLSEVKKVIVKGYIDYCETNNVPIEQAISALYDENQVGCCHNCDRCPTPIC